MKNRYQQAINNKKRRPLSVHMRKRLQEGLFLAAIACTLFLLISLFTYHSHDPGWSSTGIGHRVHNAGGRVGAWLGDIFLSLFGIVAYLFPILVLLNMWKGFRESYVEFEVKKRGEWLYKLIGWVLLMMSSCVLVDFYLPLKTHMPANVGGIVGDLLASSFSLLLSKPGSTLFFLTTLLSGITLVTGFSWLGLVDRLGEWVYALWVKSWLMIKKWMIKLRPARLSTPVFNSQQINKINNFKKEPALAENDSIPTAKELIPTKTISSAPPIMTASKQEAQALANTKINKTISLTHQTEIIAKIKLTPGTLPPVTLLNSPSPLTEKPFSHISFEELSNLVELRLADFGISTKVVAIHPGPVITRFELELAPGIKVSKITSIAKDIARSLSVVSVRVVDIIPGKSVIGLEIPNEYREVVSLREIIESQRYAQSRSVLTLVLGKDISGSPIVVDLAKMPHLLVAGTTGSGKSVGLNAMLLSLLYKSTPEQLRLILIDPKMLELSIYEGIPHLLTPVITDMKDAANALRWCVAEMDKRYRLMAALGVRNIASFNQKVTDAIKQDEPIPMPPLLVTDEMSAKAMLQPLPLIVVIADELADMMMVVGKKVEDLIARIAQKARAAGIHLILATQRPSVDVITGLIKANIPTRISFQVSSRIDSRTILDQQGAEQLLGQGDMLYLPPGAGVPTRVHGAYVADEEVHQVVAAWRTYGEPVYIPGVTEESSEGNAGHDSQEMGERDPLYQEAVRIVTESRRASISLVQRRLRIGYNRAARMMEEMEIAGIVSGMDQSGTREVLAAAVED